MKNQVIIADSLLRAMVTRLEKEQLLTTKEVKQLHIKISLKFKGKVYEF